MTNAIINGIVAQINKVFGEESHVFTEDVSQNLPTPAFIITALNPVNRQYRGRMRKNTGTYCIQYFASTGNPSGEPLAECNDVRDKLCRAMEYITVEEKLWRGTGMTGEIVDGVLHFFVDVNGMMAEAEQGEKMQELVMDLRLKG